MKLNDEKRNDEGGEREKVWEGKGERERERQQACVCVSKYACSTCRYRWHGRECSRRGW